jgi:O-antigen/teichoic acid export membrane protein
MLSQSFVNSLGYEKKTFLFSTAASAVFLLLLLLLPKFLGIYAYLFALGGELLISGGCSLLFLKKLAPPQKPFFKRCLPLFFIPLFLLPFSTSLQSIFSLTFPEPFASLLSALILSAVTALLYFLFGVFRKKR